MNTRFDVLVVGELNVDVIMNGVSKFPEIGKEVLADAMTVTLGSSSAIFASNLSTLGSRVAFAGKIGKDNFGDLIITSLQSKHVDIGNVIVTPDHHTGATIVLNFDQDRANVTYPGAMVHLAASDVTDDALHHARHLHVSSIFLQDALRKDLMQLFIRARQFGLSISLDPQWDPHERWDIDLGTLVDQTNIFMPNASELIEITRAGSFEDAMREIRKFKSTTVVKCGSDGAYLWDGKTVMHQPAFLNQKVVDSIGAGDSFNAGFIHAYLQGKSWKECLELGSAMGAVNTTRSGGTGAFEDLSQVRNIAHALFNYNL